MPRIATMKWTMWMVKQGGASSPPSSIERARNTHQSGRIRGNKKFIDDRMLACMDKCKISTRNAIHFIIAIASALGHDVKELVINRTTLESMRKDYRCRQARAILENFNVIIEIFSEIFPAFIQTRYIAYRFPEISFFIGMESCFQQCKEELKWNAWLWL